MDRHDTQNDAVLVKVRLIFDFFLSSVAFQLSGSTSINELNYTHQKAWAAILFDFNIIIIKLNSFLFG